MYQKKLDPDIRCPLEYGLEIFWGKWDSRIICVLSAKETLRYTELRSEMGNITDAVLSSTLKALIQRRRRNVQPSELRDTYPAAYFG